MLGVSFLWLLGIIGDEDVRAREACHHASCRKKYTRKETWCHDNIKESELSFYHSHGCSCHCFRQLCDYVQQQVITCGHVDHMSMLRDHCIDHMLKEHHDSCNMNYLSQKLKTLRRFTAIDFVEASVDTQVFMLLINRLSANYLFLIKFNFNRIESATVSLCENVYAITILPSNSSIDTWRKTWPFNLKCRLKVTDLVKNSHHVLCSFSTLVELLVFTSKHVVCYQKRFVAYVAKHYFQIYHMQRIKCPRKSEHLVFSKSKCWERWENQKEVELVLMLCTHQDGSSWFPQWLVQSDIQSNNVKPFGK